MGTHLSLTPITAGLSAKKVSLWQQSKSATRNNDLTHLNFSFPDFGKIWETFLKQCDNVLSGKKIACIASTS